MKGLAALAASLAACVAFVPVLSQAQVPPPMPRPAPPPMPQPPAGQYFYNENGKPVGPLTLDQIIALIKAGKISPETLVWKAGTPNWVAAKDLPDLRQQPPGPQPQPPGPQPQPAASACNGRHLVMADDFSQLPSGWQSDAASVEPGKVKLKANPGGIQWFLYPRQIGGDVDICITAQIPNRFTDANDTWAGIIFGAPDTQNFYAVTISPNGSAALFHVVNKKFDASALQIPFRQADGLKTDPGSKNVIRVSRKGSTVTIYINDQKFDLVSAQMPNGGGRLGIIVSSEEAQRDAWKFANLRVTDLQ